MKHFIYFALVALIMVSCNKSQEQKANVLIKESLKKSLYKHETYKPVETKVDSAFAPYDDPALFEALIEFGKTNTEYEQLEDKAKRAKSSMSIWGSSYRSAYERNQYQEAEDEYEEANSKMEKLLKKGKKQFDKVMAMLQSNRKFIGYKAVHNFRADNNAGNTLIGNTIFFLDENFKEVRYSMEVEEYNQVQDAIRRFVEQLDEAEE